MSATSFACKILLYLVIFFASALIFAQRFLAAFEILALPAADSTRFSVRMTFRLADSPRAFAADRKPLKSCCNLANCFSTFFSSRLIAAKMLIESSRNNLPEKPFSTNRVSFRCLIQFASSSTGGLKQLLR